MEGTISTKDLKAQLDHKQNIAVVETLAPNVFAKPIFPER